MSVCQTTGRKSSPVVGLWEENSVRLLNHGEVIWGRVTDELTLNFSPPHFASLFNILAHQQSRRYFKMVEPIGIIGSACRFPGACDSPSKLWELLSDPKDVLSSFTPERLNLSSFYHKNGEHHGSTDVQNKSYLLSEDPRLFDASFFNVNPLEADGLDPQQRILLETVYEALETAGYPIDQIQGSLTSVFVGLMTGDFGDIQVRDLETLPTYNATGTARSFLSNRISYFFDLKGPSMTIDTACSSSLVALHQAVQSLRNGDSKMAIVAGANLILDPMMYVAESTLHMLSPDSRSRMWDKSANGYARGEGFAVVVLKPLNQALEDQDHIESVVRETAVNSDGRTKGITMPSAAAQTTLIRQAYRNAGLDPVLDRCQYFEAHGTGTLAGDPVEARAIRDAFFPEQDPEQQSLPPGGDVKLPVGSIKTVVGHLEGCAGLAGLLKASLAIQHRTIPPNMHFEELNPSIAPFYDRLHVPTSPMPWPEIPGTPLRASVNSFGFGGTNAHAIIESYEPKTENQDQGSYIDEHSLDERFVGPLILSANSDSSLLETVQNFAEYIRRDIRTDLADLSWVLQARRSDLPVKAFFSGATRQKLLAYMDKYVEENAAAAAVAASTGVRADFGAPSYSKSSKEAPAVLGIFTGQGAQWATMGRNLIAHCRLFRESIERCEMSLADLLEDAPQWSLKAELMADEASSRISDAVISQPLCTAVQISMVDLLSAAGINLHAVVGHSSGEIAAVYAAGIISSKDAMRIAYYRGYHAKLAQGVDGQSGGMIAVGISFDSALRFCAKPEFSGRLGIAASNAESSVTLSGDLDAIKEAKEYFDLEKTFARLLNVDTAYHSHHMIPCSRPYLESLKACNIQVSHPREDCTWVSSVRGDTDLLEEDLETLTGQYWVDNLLKPVLFSEAVECALWSGGPFGMVAEVGCHPALKGPATQIFKSTLGSPLPYLSLMRRGDDEVDAFSGGIGYVWSHLGPSFIDFNGYREAFNASYLPAQKMLKGLPSYAWDHGRIHWKESRISRNFRLRDNHPHELLGRRVPDDTADQMRWRNILRLNEIPWVKGHLFQGQIILPGASYVSMAVEAAKVLADGHALKLIEVRDLNIPRPVILREGHDSELITTIRRVHDVDSAKDEKIMRAELACYVCSDDAYGSPEQTCTGQIYLHLGRPASDELPLKSQAPSNLVPVDMERFYSLLKQLGLNYQGPFLGMDSASRTLGYASASGSWKEVDVGNQYSIHPAVLDVIFQTVFAAYSSPSTGRLWSPYLPIGIRRVIVDPFQCPKAVSGQVRVDMDAFITSSSSTLLEADLQIPTSGGSHAGIQIEGLKLKAIVDPKASGDRLLFAETKWDIDISTGLANPVDGEHIKDDEGLVEIIERTALYYFQVLLDAIAPPEIENLKWHHQLLINAAQYHLGAIRGGRHPAAKGEWMEDTKEVILNMAKRYPQQIDLALMRTLGENLVSIVRGETQVLEVMMENDMLNRLYMEGCGFRMLNEHIARAISQITHKYPQANILEIGAGTGGTTKKVLDTIGTAYSAYAYTDISPGFFEKASEKFAEHRNKMVFKTLDVEKVIGDQGFEEEQYDIVIAANVLHATRKLTETMQHVRSLLRPGGYLVMMEVTGDLLRIPFLMGALPGWWLGAESGDHGRRLGPGVSPVKWDEILQNTGFSGVDSMMHDMSDTTKHSCSMIISQAVDDKFEILRDPLSSIGLMPTTKRLLIIGGKTLPVAKLARDMKKLLFPWKHLITTVDGLDALDGMVLSESISVICLTELDMPLFSEPMTSARLRILQYLLSKARNVLWTTAGSLSDSPESNMFVGIGRALSTEQPHLNLQFVDIQKTTNFNATVLVEVFLRLTMMSIPEYAGHNMLWHMEPEIALNDNTVLIPRVIQNKIINERYNASRRLITKQTTTSNSCVELVASGGTLSLMGTGCQTKHRIPPGHTTIDVRYSVNLPSRDLDPCFLCLGIVHGTTQTALAISNSNRSAINVSSERVLFTEPIDGDEATTLQAIATHMIARTLLSAIPTNGSVLIYEPEEILATSITHHKAWKDREVYFATSKTSPLPEGWLHIHPYALERVLRQEMPRDIQCVVDFSTPECRSIKSCVPRTCIFRSFEHSLMDHSKDDLTRHNILAECYTEAKSYMLKLSQPKLEYVSAVQDLQGAPVSDTLYPYVIDWCHTHPLDVGIKPLETSGLFSPTRTYFMVGMTGELGQSICRWMISNGARYIVLTSRRGEVNSTWFDEMQRQGATIKLHKMDVSDRDSIRSVYNVVKDTMPSIAGVCNAAMVLSDKLFLDMDIDTLNDTLKPKVDGSRYLDELFAEDTLDFFVLFSSVASVVGNGGQSNYHAANMFMGSLATNRRQRGLAASVINIGMVVDAGYVVRAGRRIEDHLRNLFYIPLSESDVHHLFAEAVLAGHPDSEGQPDITMGIEPFEDHAGAKVRPPWYSNPRFSHLRLQKQVHEEPQQMDGTAMHIRQKLEEANSEESAQMMLQESFSSKLESMLQLVPGSVNFNVPLLDLGCDSLLAVEIRTWFLKEIHVEVPVLKLLSGDSVTEICHDAASQYLASKSKKVEKSLSSPATDGEEAVIKDSKEEADLNAKNSDSSQNLDGWFDSSSTGVTPDLSQLAETGTVSSFDFMETSSMSTREPSLVRKSSESMDFRELGLGKERDTTRVEKMSYAQSRIWFLTEYLEDPTTYNIAVSYNLNGKLDVARFQRAFSAVIANHESLRTYFYANPDSDEPMQGVLRSASAPLKCLQTSNQKDIDHEFQVLRNHSWDLAQGQTFRATLISRRPDWHTIIFGYHHIVMDGVSWHLFLRDLKLAYEMKPLKRASKQYVEFSLEQMRAVERGDFDDQVKFWKSQHAQLPEVIPLLPIASARGRKPMRNYDSHTVSRDTGRSLVAKIKSASQTLRVTPFHFYLATIQVLLSKFLDIEDLCIGVADANRTDDSIAETVGFFLNLLPLRFQVSKRETFSELVKKTSKSVFAALNRSNVPFDVVLEKLKVPRHSSHSPLFQVAVNYRLGAMVETHLGDCQMVLDSVEDARNAYDMGFGITESSAGSCLLQVTCQSYLYSVEAGNLLMDAYVCLLENLSSDTLVRIQDCSMFDSSQARHAIDLGTGPRVEFGWPETLSAQVDSMCLASGKSIAIKDQHGEMTYSQLAEQAGSITTAILATGLPRESRIAVLCQPSAGLIACMLAILRTGNVYVPLDLSLPQARHAAILENCKPSAILCQQETLEAAHLLSRTRMRTILISDLSIIAKHGTKSQKSQKVESLAQPKSPAFLFYTSGSTGVPKGMLLSQAGFVNHVALKSKELSLHKEVVLQQSSFGFDMSLTQTFCALANGGTLVIVPQEVRGDPVEIAKLMLKENVTFTIATPSEYLMLLRYGGEPLRQYSSWHHACMGGEVVTDRLMQEFSRLDKQNLVLTNCYGPTEISLAASFGKVSVNSNEPGVSDSYVSVGKPLPNYSIYILDEECKPLPVGFPGEVCIGGAGVALGYFDLPELTKSKFVPDPFAAQEDTAKGWTKMFKTGDKGRLLADGSLMFMGRKEGDTQIKLRGLRIELEDVASTLLQAAPGMISEAVITVRGDPQILVAHVVFEAGESMDDTDLQTLLRDLPLPQYMCPAMIIPLEHLPHNSNGKVDRKAIESMPLPTQMQKAQPQEVLTLSEGELGLLWEDVLQQTTTRHQLGRNSDFFMVGGNSVLLVTLQGAIKGVLGIAISIMELYQASTLGHMAARINSKKEQQAPEKYIDWALETEFSGSMAFNAHPSQELKPIKHFDREVLLTGSETFLGSEILQSLLKDLNVRRIHCVAVSPQGQKGIPRSEKIVVHKGSLQDASLGLSGKDIVRLQSCIDLIIHAGAVGHCLNNYSSLRVPNLHSTRFIANLALPRLIPVHFLSSNRVTLLSGSTALPPISLASYSPPLDGSEGYTASKWASERYLENVAQETGLRVCVHRTCAVTGDRAPSEDALNALLRFSKLIGAVPQFENFKGFFDFRDVQEVGNEITKEALADYGGKLGVAAAIKSATVGSSTSPAAASLRFMHHSSGVRVPVREFRQRMELIHGCPFKELGVAEWIDKARELGIETLITTYLEALVEKKETISFPYLGERGG